LEREAQAGTRPTHRSSRREAHLTDLVAQQLDALERTNADALKLGRLASLAARVETDLLRRLRLRFLPNADPSSEADLWFSPLIETRNVLGLVFSNAALAALRANALSELSAGDRTDLRKILRLWHPTDTLLGVEEELTFLALDGDVAGFDAELRRLVAALAKAIEQGDDRLQNKLSIWVFNAWARLPIPADSQAAAELYLLAGLEVGKLLPASPLNLEDVGAFPELLLRAGTTWVRVAIEGDRVLFSAIDEPNGLCVEVPNTHVLVLLIDVGGRRQRLLVPRDAPEPLALHGAGSFAVTTLGGRYYEFSLERAPVANGAEAETSLGAEPGPEGTWFRVWAPSALSVVVEVAGGVSATLHPSGDGVWAAHVPEVRPGVSYRYLLTVRDGRVLQRCDPRARSLDTNLWAVVPEPSRPRPPFPMPSHDALVIYQLHVGTFNAGPDTPGTFASVVEKLDYLRDLGINVIELLPVAEDLRGVNPGYGASHPFAVKRAYGTPDELRVLVQAAHQRGIAVIQEVVLSHLAPENNSLWNFDGESSGGGLYFDGGRQTPWGSGLAYWKLEVRQYARDNARMWLEEYGMDGIHLSGLLVEDGAMVQAVQDLARDLRFQRPWVLITLESVGSGLDTREIGMSWDVRFGATLREQLASRAGARVPATAFDLMRLREVFCGPGFDGWATNARVISVENFDYVGHDRERLPGLIGSSNAPRTFAACEVAAALALTAPGTPLIYQGFELMTREVRLGERWLDWIAPADFVPVFRALVRLRLSEPALRGEHLNVFHVNTHDRVLAMHRWSTGGGRDDLVIVANLGERSFPEYLIGVPFDGAWRVVFAANTDRAPSEPLTTNGRGESRDGLNATLTLSLEPDAVLLLRYGFTEQVTATTLPHLSTPGTLNIDHSGILRRLILHIDVIYARPRDSIISLRAPDGTEAVVHDRAGGDGNNIVQSYDSDSLPALKRLLACDPRGEWQLNVRRADGENYGRLDKFSLDLTIEPGDQAVVEGPSRSRRRESSHQPG
jgi:1,4-alpha-glucan branching enzyme